MLFVLASVENVSHKTYWFFTPKFFFLSFAFSIPLLIVAFPCLSLDLAAGRMWAGYSVGAGGWLVR